MMPRSDSHREYDSLEDIGWTEELAAEFQEYFGDQNDVIPGRIAVRYKGQYAVLTEDGEIAARIKGYLRYKAETWAELPVVGDWVAIKKKEHETLWRIQGILERRTVLRRKVKGSVSSAQVMAANVTKAIIVMGLNEDYNIRRLERYFVLIHDSGIQPIVVLNKADLLDEDWLEDSIAEVEEVAKDQVILPISALKQEGIETVEDYICSKDTVVFLGSSGAGKSTLVNALVGENRQVTSEVRDDGKGRHTTTVREMVFLPNGAIVIDSPGIREIQLWAEDSSEEEAGLSEAFSDIEELAAQCRFPNCTHTHEPDCAVKKALDTEELDPLRFDNYLRMKEEIEATRAREVEAKRKGKNRAFRPKKKHR